MSRSNRSTLWRTTNAGGKRAATRTIDTAKDGDTIVGQDSVTVDEIVLTDVGRISTGTSAGTSLALDASTATHAEGMEMRWHIADWSDTVTWTEAKGMYLRMENRETNSAASLYGAQIYGVSNNVANTQYLWGALVYAYDKGAAGLTSSGIYALQPEITFDAATASSTITDAAIVRAKLTGGTMSDYTVLDGYRLTLGDMNGGSRTYGNGILLEDDSAMSGTCALTTGININIGTTTAISVAGAYTTGISLSGDGTTAINVTSGFSGTDGIILGGTHSDAGIEIDGTCADGIRIDGACSDNGIEIVGACTDSAIQVVTGGFATGLLLDADGTTGINITSNFSGVDGIILGGTHSDCGIEIDGTAADGIRIDGACSDNGIEIVGACTDSAIKVVTGGFATGLALDADGTTGIDITSNFTGTTGIQIAGTAADGILISGACSDNAIEITGACTDSAIKIVGTAMIASGEQAIYVSCPSETAAVNAVWLTVRSTVTSGDLGGVRAHIRSNAASGGSNIRALRGEAEVGASKYAAYACGVLAEVDVSAGSCDVDTIEPLCVQFSEGASLTATNFAGIKLNIQTLGTESFGGYDAGIYLVNEGHNGAGRTIADGILIAESAHSAATAFTNAIQVSAVCTSILTVSGTASYFADFDNATTCATTTESGAATTIKGNILVKTVAGATGYINVYGSAGS